jgi:hypothetical protein
LHQAIEAYREVINAAPEHAETLSALESLFEAGTNQLEVAEILEPLYQSAAEWEKLIRVREAELAHTKDPEQRVVMYHRIAEDAEERLLDPVLAFNVYVRAIRESALDERTGEEIERLAGMIDNGWEQLANAYADVSASKVKTLPRKLRSASVWHASSRRSWRTFPRRRKPIATCSRSCRRSRKPLRTSIASTPRSSSGQS